jgi:hypothetical protein
MKTALQVGDRLPHLVLPSWEGKEITVPSPHQGSLALLLLPSEHSEFADYLERFLRAVPALQGWYGRPMLILDGTVKEIRDLLPARTDALPVLADAQGKVRTRMGLEPHQAAIMIADRWGQIYFIGQADRAGELPATEEVEEWLKFLATQCPECGVPDEPGYGDWALA